MPKMVKKQYHNKLDEIYKQSGDVVSYLKSYGNYLSELLAALDHDEVRRVADCFLKARALAATIYFVGNGGSAATASHFAQDLTEVGRKAGLNGFRTLSLTDSVPYITALANDYGYESVFTWQLAELFKKNDVLVAISASGNSPNVVNAVQYAKKSGGVTIGLVGFDGGKLKTMCDHVINVKTRPGEYGPVEDVHMVLDHMITTYLLMKLRRSQDE